MHVNEMDIASTVRPMVAELAGMKTEEVLPESRLEADLGLDSLQSMELLSRLSEHFAIDPEMEDVVNVETIGDVVRFVARYLHGDGAASGAGSGA